MRRDLKWLAWVLLVLALLLVMVAAAPMQTNHGGCEFCGRSRSETWLCGIKVKDRIRETAGSAWVDQMYPNHRDHIWSGGSSEQKGWGLGGLSIGCGYSGAGAIAQIHYLRSVLGEDQAREVLQKYHSQLRSDRTQLHQWLNREFQASVPGNELRSRAVD